MPAFSAPDFDECLRQGEPGPRERAGAWQAAIGLRAVDGLRPSAYLIETARHSFMKNWLAPAQQLELVCPLCPDSPHLPRQKYLATEKGRQRGKASARP